MITSLSPSKLGCFVMASQAWLSREMLNGSCCILLYRVKGRGVLGSQVDEDIGFAAARAGGRRAPGGETGPLDPGVEFHHQGDGLSGTLGRANTKVR